MNETVKLIGDYGMIIVFLGAILALFVKYIPTLMNIWIDRLKTRNSNSDLTLEVIRNNTGALENNSKVIESNTIAMKKNSEHYDKINGALDRLITASCEKEKRDEIMAKDIAILKERNK